MSTSFSNMFNPQSPFIDQSTGLIPVTASRLRFFSVGTNAGKSVYTDFTLTTPVNDVAPDLATGMLHIPLYLGVGDYDSMLQIYVSGDPSDDSNWRNGWNARATLSGAPVPPAYASVGTIAIMGTHADLKASQNPSGLYGVWTLGYWSAGDGGGGFFRWNSGLATADNLGTIVRPTGIIGSGGWQWVPTNDDGTVSASIFGLCAGRPSPCDSYLISAQAWAQGELRTLVFHAGLSLPLSANVTINCTVDIANATSFSSSTGSAINVVFNGKGSTCRSYANVASTNVTLYAAAGVFEYVRPEWVSSSVGNTQQVLLAGANFTQTPVRFTAGVTWNITGTNSTLSSPVQFEFGAVLSVNMASSNYFRINGEISMIQSGRWQAINLLGGYFSVGANHTGDVQAWWFGWGQLLATNQATLLNAAYIACSDYSHRLNISQNASGKGIGGTCQLSNFEVDIAIEGYIEILSGGTLSIDNIISGRRKLFQFDAGATNDAVSVLSGTVYPEWFGAYADNSHDDTLALIRATVACAEGSTAYVPTWLDGGGSCYYIASTYAVQNLGYIGIKDLTLRSGNVAASTLNFYHCNNIWFRNVSVVNTVACTVATVQFGDTTGITAEQFNISHAGSLAYLMLKGASGHKYRNCEFVCLVADQQSKLVDDLSDTAGIKFDHCSIGLSNSIGNTAIIAGYGYTFQSCNIYASGASGTPWYLTVTNNVNKFLDCDLANGSFVLKGYASNYFQRNRHYGNADINGYILAPQTSSVAPSSVWISYNTLENPGDTSASLFVKYDNSSGKFGIVDIGMCVGKNTVTDTSTSSEGYCTYKRGYAVPDGVVGYDQYDVSIKAIPGGWFGSKINFWTYGYQGDAGGVYAAYPLDSLNADVGTLAKGADTSVRIPHIQWTRNHGYSGPGCPIWFEVSTSKLMP